LKTTTRLLAIAAMFIATLAQAQGNDAMGAAENSAAAWLHLVDTGHYADTWAQAATMFRNAVTSASWQQKVGAARVPLGAVQSRTLVNVSYSHKLPGAPDGNYVFLAYETAFEHKPQGGESLVVAQEPDGSWHVAGYYIHDANAAAQQQGGLPPPPGPPPGAPR